MLTIASISLSDAKRIINAAEAKAMQIGSPGNVAVAVAVVDAGGNRVAHVPMDGAQPASISHSINKAFTSLACKTATLDLAADAQPGASLYGIAHSVDGRIITFAGCMPLESGDSFVGAVGGSGSTADQNQAVAEAPVAAL